MQKLQLHVGPSQALIFVLKLCGVQLLIFRKSLSYTSMRTENCLRGGGGGGAIVIDIMAKCHRTHTIKLIRS